MKKIITVLILALVFFVAFVSLSNAEINQRATQTKTHMKV